MPSGGSIPSLIQGLNAGDESAARKLWEDYFAQVVQLARKKLRGLPRRVASAEDVALSALKSLCLGARKGRFPLLVDRNSLWRLLVVLTARKAADQANYEGRLKRGGDKKRGDSSLTARDWASYQAGIEQIMDVEPGPATLVQMAEDYERLLGSLGDETLRKIAVWSMEGYTSDEMAAKLGATRRTITRRLELIRKIWISREGGNLS